MPKAPVSDIVTYYEEAGSGDALVLLTGLGADLQSWALTAPALAKQFHVVMPDNRGAGRTSAPDRPYAIAQMAGDVVALLDRLGIEKAHLVGFSMGGFVAQEVAINHPGRVEKLVLMNTAGSIDGYGRAILRSLIDIRRSNMSREQQVRHMAHLLYSPALLDDDARYERGLLNSLANPYQQQDHAFIRQAQACMAFDATGRHAKIKAQTLVVASSEDMFVPARNGQKLAKAISGATFKELPGGHVGFIEYPNEYNAALLEFLG